MDQDQIEARIRQCVDRVRSEGIKIAAHSYGVEKKSPGAPWTVFDFGDAFPKKCCPLGAVLLCTTPTPPESGPGAAAGRILGTSVMWRHAFIGGFDGDSLPDSRPVGPDEKAGHELGVKLRNEYIKGEERAD